MRTLLVVASLAAVALCGCTVKKIPGTDIDDTSDTRAVLDVVNAYRVAVEHRNVDALIELADESFRDDGGSSGPDDDLDYKTLRTALPARFARIEDLHLDLSVRKVAFDDEAKSARVTYTYTLAFKLPQLSSRAQQENDIKQMTLKRVDEKTWKIVSGI